MEWLLDDFYDTRHRAYMMAEEGKVLRPLKIRYHGATTGMPYDERYTEHIETLGLLPFISLVSRSTPHFNAAAITALVDRWRPETHTFHLRAGEMTPTLQDVSMILGLPIEGKPLCMDTDSDGWRQQMYDLIGRVPPEPESKAKRVTAGASYKWIVANFANCPRPADDETIKIYSKVYVWYVISRTLFADGGGKMAQWMWLKAVSVLDHKWSWGTAALAYLYRQLDDACLRIGNGKGERGSSGIGGCMLLLSVWSWEHLEVGRPKQYPRRDWNDHGNPLRYPTWAYRWDVVSEMTNDVELMYGVYTEELDSLTPEQVEWEPYGDSGNFGRELDYLNPKCLEEQALWRMRCPLICNWAVEYHMPHRVMTQFGLLQQWPPQWQDTDRILHGLDRKKQRKVKNWPDTHRTHVTAFLVCVDEAKKGERSQPTPYSEVAFNDYLKWFQGVTRLELCKHAYDAEILEEPIVFEELAQSTYNRLVRQGTSTPFARSLNFVRAEIKKQADECEVMYVESGQDKEAMSALRDFVKRTGQKLRRLGNLLGCRDGEIATPPLSRSGSPTGDDSYSANDEHTELGMASALETLCGQSYGAQQYHMLGIYLQRSWIILSSCAVLMLPIFLFTESLLVFIGQDPKIATVAGLISVWYIPIMFANLCNFSLQMYLQAQSKNLIVTYLSFVNLGTHLFLSWLLTMKFHFGLAGVMSSMVISLWIPVSGQLIFVFCGACPLTWTGFSSEALTDLFPILKLSLSSGVMLCLEMWYNTILVLLTGYMKNPEVTLDALSICLNINGWELMISMGFLSATGVRVANELGAGSARRAKFAIVNVVTTSFSIGLALFAFFLLFQGNLSYIFTTSEEVAAAVAGLSPLLAVSILMNSVQPVLSGVAVGAGWQSIVAYVNITTYYLIGIPLGAILGYVLGYHVKGVWVGMLLGTLVQTVVLLFITIRTDWDKQVEVTRQRLNKWFIGGNREKAASSGSP